MASMSLIHELSCIPYLSPGRLPKRMTELEKQAVCAAGMTGAELPRSVKPRPEKYGVKKSNKNNVTQA